MDPFSVPVSDKCSILSRCHSLHAYYLPGEQCVATLGSMRSRLLSTLSLLFKIHLFASAVNVIVTSLERLKSCFNALKNILIHTLLGFLLYKSLVDSTSSVAASSDQIFRNK